MSIFPQLGEYWLSQPSTTKNYKDTKKYLKNIGKTLDSFAL